MEGNNRKVIFQVVLFIATFLAAFFATKSFFGKSKERIAMEQKIDSLNRKLPFVIEDFLRADKITILDKDTLDYSFTLLTVDKGSPQVVIDAMKFDYRNRSQAHFDNDKRMQVFRDANAIIKYSYNDRNGKPLFSFVVKSDKKE